MKKGSEVIVDILVENGFSRVFGVPGRRVLPIYDEIYKQSNRISVVPSQNEQGAAFMADGYARTGKMSCCLGISGPGLLNMVTGVAAANYDSVPLLVLGGQAQVQSIGRYAIQEATGFGRSPDQLGVYSSLTKWATRVGRCEDIAATMMEAIERMSSGRPGPVYVEFPTNVLHEDVASPKVYSVRTPPPAPTAPDLPGWDFDGLVDDLAAAKHPLLLIGAGVNASGSRALVQKIVKQTGIPYVTTTLAKGSLPEQSDQSLGSCGIWGQPAARAYMLDHTDAVIALGTTFQELSSYGWRVPQDAVLCRVDIDPDELARNYAGKHTFCGHMKPFLEELSSVLDARDTQMAFPAALKTVAEMKAKHGYYTSIPHANEDDVPGAVNPIALVKSISELTPDETTIITDVGENGAWSMYLIQRNIPGSYVINAGLGSMGHSAAAAVGISFGKERKTVSICGDGGLMMNGNEIATSAMNGGDVLWVVFNNGILGTQKHYQRDYLEERYIACEMPEVDYCKYAESMGVPARRVTSITEFRDVYAEMLSTPGNGLIEVIVDPEIKPEPCFFY